MSNQGEWYERLKWSSDDRMWWGRDRVGSFDVGLSGTGNSPNLEHCEALHLWVVRAKELRAAAAEAISGRVVNGKSGDTRVEVKHIRCDAQDIDVVSLSSSGPEILGAFELKFVTGYPDGYFLYTIRFQNGTPAEASFEFW
jgi:hypothetical protein